MARIPRTLAALLVVTGASFSPDAHSAPADPLERARQLFIQAESDEDAEHWLDALEKFNAVAEVKQTAGVRYHVALCEEHLGRLVRALADYRAAEQQARLENARDVLRSVGKQLAALDPRVPRLTIRQDPAVPEAALKLDGEPLPASALDAAIPVDPGGHSVEATAPNQPLWTDLVTVQERESKVLDIRFPKSAPATLPPTIPVPQPTAVASSRAGAIASTAVAIALVGAGAAAVLVAGNEHDRDVSACARAIQWTCPGAREAVRAWDFAAAGIWTGALVAGTIAVVLWTQPHREESATIARVVVGPGEIDVEGRF